MATLNNKVKLIYLSLLFTAITAVISIAVYNNRTANFDLETLKYVYSLRNTALTAIMHGISSISSTPFTGLLTAVVIFWLWFKKYHKTAIFFGGTLLTSVIANNIIKYSVHRFRPDIVPLENDSFYSFPSGHSMNSLVFYGLLLYIANKSIKNKSLKMAINIIAPVFVLLVGFSRVYLGAHYPTDVIAGFCAGAVVLAAAIAFDSHGNVAKDSVISAN